MPEATAGSPIRIEADTHVREQAVRNCDTQNGTAINTSATPAPHQSVVRPRLQLGLVTTRRSASRTGAPPK